MKRYTRKHIDNYPLWVPLLPGGGGAQRSDVISDVSAIDDVALMLPCYCLYALVLTMCLSYLKSVIFSCILFLMDLKGGDLSMKGKCKSLFSAILA